MFENIWEFSQDINFTIHEPLTDHEYAITYKTYLESTQEKQAALRLATPIIKSFEGRSIDILSIGCAYGKLEELFRTELGLKINSFYGVEPNKVFCEMLEEQAKKWGVKYNIEACGFSENYKLDQKFDLIMMSQCVYFFDDKIAALLNAKSMLKQDGKLMIFHEASNTGAGFAPIIDREAQPGYMNCYDLAKHLNEKGVKNSIHVTDTTDELIIDDFVRKIETPTATHMPSFFLYTIYEKLDQQTQELIHEKMKAKAYLNKEGKYCTKLLKQGMLIIE